MKLKGSELNSLKPLRSCQICASNALSTFVNNPFCASFSQGQGEKQEAGGDEMTIEGGAGSGPANVRQAQSDSATPTATPTTTPTATPTVAQPKFRSVPLCRPSYDLCLAYPPGTLRQQSCWWNTFERPVIGGECGSFNMKRKCTWASLTESTSSQSTSLNRLN